MAKSDRTSKFKVRLKMEDADVRDRFEAPYSNQPPGMEQLILSDPITWGMPLGLFVKCLRANPSFLPSGGEELLEKLLKYDTPNVNTRVAVDLNLPPIIILAIYAYHEPSDTVSWLTIGST